MKPNNAESKQSIKADRGGTIQNVIQAVFHLPGWAWISGMAVVTAGLCIAIIGATIIFNWESIEKLLPAPPPFATATANESLIIVADFDNRSGGKYTGIDPAQYIYDQLHDQIEKDHLNIRAERLRQVVNDNNAKSIGERYNATMVVWGWYDALRITPRIQRIKLLKGDMSTQDGVKISLANPEKVEFSIVTDLPAQANYLVMFTLGVDKYSNNQFDDALSYFDHAIQAATSNASTSVNPSEAYYYHGSSYYYKGNYSLASADFAEALHFNQNNIDAHKGRLAINFKLGLLDLVIADSNIIIELDANDAEAYISRGAAYNSKGDYDRSIADYNKGMELNPSYSHIFYYNRGISYKAKGEYDLAIADFTKAIELRPEEADAYVNRGFAYNAKGDDEHAFADYNKAIELDPNNAVAYNNRGNSYIDRGEFDLALADYTKAIELDPNYALSYNNRCWFYYERGEYDKALPDCEKALSLDPNNDHILGTRAFVYEALGRKDDAIKDFEYILENSADPSLLKYAEDELRKLKGQ